MQLDQEEETPAQMFFCKLSEIFKKTGFVEHVRNGCSSEMNQKKLYSKGYSQESTGDGVPLVQLQTCGLTVFPKGIPSQILFYENFEVLQNIIFTEHCCTTVSDFL